MSWCKKCGEFDVWGKGCRCTLIGHVWKPEGGETEDDAREVWSASGYVDTALREWAARHDASNGYESFEHEQTLAFRPSGKPVEYHTVTRETEPVYRVSEASDDERESARSQQARTLRSQRKYQRERAKYLAAKSASETMTAPTDAKTTTSA